MRKSRQFIMMSLAVLTLLMGTSAVAMKHVEAESQSTVPPTNTHAPTITEVATLPPTNTHAPTITPFPSDTPTPAGTSTFTPTLGPTPTPSHTPTITRTPTNTMTATPIPDAVTIQGFQLLNGPGYFYLKTNLVASNTPVTIISRTDDASWFKISYFPAKNIPAREGWIEAKALHLNIDGNAITPISLTDLEAIPVTNSCVAIVGDSIAAGGAIFEIPEIGYVRAPMAPMSSLISQRFQKLGVKVKVLDRSVAATGISSSNHPSYFDTPQYAQVLRDNCKFTIIFPWVNDLSPADPNPAASAPGHAAAITTLIQRLANSTTFGRIILLNYYLGNPTDFSLKGFATGFTPAVISVFNQQLAAACAALVGSIKSLTCVDINNAFTGMGTSYVVGQMTRDQINAQLVSSINDQELAYYNYYADGHPGGLFRGDGVHLSLPGKIALATYLVGVMQALPDLRPFIQPTRTPTPTLPPTATVSPANTDTSSDSPTPAG